MHISLVSGVWIGGEGGAVGGGGGRREVEIHSALGTGWCRPLCCCVNQIMWFLDESSPHTAAAHCEVKLLKMDSKSEIFLNTLDRISLSIETWSIQDASKSIKTQRVMTQEDTAGLWSFPLMQGNVWRSWSRIAMVDLMETHSHRSFY